MTSHRHSIRVPIILGVISVGLAIAMLVAWILVLVYSDLEANWLLVLGIISLSWILLVLGGFAFFLVAEILEVRRQQRFVDSVTHELRSPLTSLRMGLQTLARPQLDADQRTQVRVMMLGDVQRLSAFVDDIRTANRVGGNAIEARLRSVPLADAVNAAVAAALARREADPARVIVDAIPSELTVRADPGALDTVLVNLIDNALKYSDAPAPVRVHALHDVKRGWVGVQVHDQGIGLTRQERRRMRRRFYRADREAVRGRPGTGLGLYVVDGLIRAQGGRLRAESPGPGRGTTMHVSLPAGDPA